MADVHALVRAIMPLVGRKPDGSKERETEDVMPYERDEDLPDNVQALPAEDRAKWKRVFNGVVKAKGEETAFATAWSAVRGNEKDKTAAEVIATATRADSERRADPIGRLMQLYELTGQKKVLIFPRGTFKHPQYGEMVFDTAFFEEIKKNYDEKVLGQTFPFVDVEHTHGAAAGWMDQGLSIEEDGLFALVNWTKLGEQKVGTGEYRYFSPWWGQFEDPASGKKYNRVLRGGALTNVPFLKVLPPLELMEPGNDNVKRARTAGASTGGRVWMLSELTAVVEHHALDDEDNLEILPQRIRMAFGAKYSGGPFYSPVSSPWIVPDGVHEDHVIVCIPSREGREEFFLLPWAEEGGEIVFRPESRIQVERVWQPVAEAAAPSEPTDELTDEQLAEIRETQGPGAALAAALGRRHRN